MKASTIGIGLGLAAAAIGIAFIVKSTKAEDGEDGGDELPAGTYRVTIKDDSTGYPISGATVKVGDMVIATNSLGYADFLPAPGTYFCSVTASGYSGESWNREIDGEHDYYSTTRRLDVS